ncbi:MAG: protease complex subunit PrcB family protein [Pseudomonadales bacterium]
MRRRALQPTCRTGALAAVMLLASGCGAGPRIDATSVLSYDRCRGIDAGITRVDFADVAGIRGGTLLNMTRPQPDADGAADEPLLVAISRGRQSTPGYAMTLEDARRRGTTALVTVTWATPGPGAVLEEKLTHPCLVVALPRGELTRIEAVDQNDNPLGSLDL